MAQLEAQGATAFAMDCIPRLLSRGQTFDALSSQVSRLGQRNRRSVGRERRLEERRLEERRLDE
jgi:hypothetical protein